MPYAVAADSVHQLEAYTKGAPDAPSHRSTSRCTIFATELDEKNGDETAAFSPPSFPASRGFRVSTSATSAGTEGSAATSPGATSLCASTSTCTFASVRSVRCLVTEPSERSNTRHGGATKGATAPRRIADDSSNSAAVSASAGQRVRLAPRRGRLAS